MKISIITACFNSAATLPDTLESVLSQTYSNYELIVVDGGSTDGTVAILTDYQHRFDGRMRWVSEPDKGIYDAMNKGIAMASGDIIGFLNSDDYYYDSEALQSIADAFSAHPDIDAVHANLEFINNNKEVVRIWKGAPYRPGIFNTGWSPAHPTFYCKRECFDKYGTFNISLTCSADFELMLRFIEKQRIAPHYINKNIVKMRVGGESTSGIKSLIKSKHQLKQAFLLNQLSYPHFYYFKRILSKLATIRRIV